MSKGVLMYAHNNPEIDYFKIACANALLVKYNLGVPVTLVTDAGSLNWGIESLGKELVDQCFETVITVDQDYSFKNKRTYSDALTSKTLQFYNCNHWQAFYLSPYDETLFIDVDYLIMSDALANCWGNENDILINSKIFNPGDTKDPYAKSIDDFGITMYWATVIYFKKTDYAKFIFDTVKHIQENYEYFRHLYYFSNGMYRNDYAFSIAIHMMNGFTTNNTSVTELPISGLLMSWDTHNIYKVNGINDITLYTEKEQKGQYMLVRLKNQDVHIMNKWAINRVSDNLIDTYRKAL